MTDFALHKCTFASSDYNRELRTSDWIFLSCEIDIRVYQ